MNTSLQSPETFFRILNETKEPAFDVETNGLRWQHEYVVGYSVSDGTTAVYVPVRHSGGGNIDNVVDFEHNLNRSVNNHSGRIVGHNIKFDMHFSQNHGIFLGNKVADTMVNECLLDENRRSYSLENVSKDKKYDITPKLGKQLYEHISQQTGCKPDRNAMGHFHRLSGADPIAVEYAAGDTLTTKQLYEKQKKQLYKEELDLVVSVENELTYVLQKMERRGVIVDPKRREEVVKKIDDMYWEAFAKIPVKEDESGAIAPMNIRSKLDLKEYFEHCEITDWPMTAPTESFPNGQPSFNRDFLETNEEGLNILNVRRLATLKSMFLDVLDKFLYENRLHTTFNQTRGETHGTRFGRLSSNHPNMQFVPKRDEELGRIYRSMFVPYGYYIFVEYDYSQAEPRLYTHYSGEPALLKGYTSTPVIDMHSVAAEYMGVSRGVAKNLNLGMMYTMGAKKLAIKLKIPLQEAYRIYKLWHETFQLVSTFTKRAEKVAQDRGYVKTLLGRRSRFDHPDYCYRAANRIVQGSSADVLKFKMIEIDRYLVKNNLEDVCRMILTIHDSILFEIHKEHTYLIKVIKEILEKVQIPPFNLKIPMPVDFKQGEDWADASYS